MPSQLDNVMIHAPRITSHRLDPFIVVFFYIVIFYSLNSYHPNCECFMFFFSSFSDHFFNAHFVFSDFVNAVFMFLLFLMYSYCRHLYLSLSLSLHPLPFYLLICIYLTHHSFYFDLFCPLAFLSFGN